MDVLYSAVISKEATPQLVGEFTDSSSHAAANDAHPVAQLRSIALAVAAQANPGDRVSVTASGLAGHYVFPESSNQIAVLIAAEGVPRRQAFAVLAEVASELPLDSATAARELLSRAIREVAAAGDSLHGAHRELESTRKVVVDSLDRLLERGERMSLLVDRTSEVSSSAQQFRRQATAVRRHFWWQNIRVMAVGGLATGGVILGLMHFL